MNIIDSDKINSKQPNQEKIWDSISKPWKNYVIKEIPIVVDFLKNKKGKIIDFGCGTGRNMLSKDLEYYCVDFSKGQLIHCKRNAKQRKIKAEFFKQDISKLDKKIFKNKMFDYGLFISTLHCIEDNKKRLSSLKEFYRILKPKSLALISVWNSKDKRFKNKSKNIYLPWMENQKPFLRYYHLYEKKELINILKKIGFKIEKIYKSREHDRFSKKNLIILVRK